MKNYEHNLDFNKSNEYFVKKFEQIFKYYNNRDIHLITNSFEYREKGQRRFKFESSDFFAEESEISSETAEVHFLPITEKYRQGVMDTQDVDEKDRRRFKRESIVKLYIGLENLVSFITCHPETRLGKVKLFHGITNKEMAEFMKNRLGINYDENPNDDGEFVVIFTLDQLLEGFNAFKTKHGKMMEELKEELS